MIKKFGAAVWNGSLKEGGGTISTESGQLDGVPYSHATRFADKKGTNPEELIGAAHASCYSMFLSALMGGDGITPKSIETTSTISLDPNTEGGPTVMAAHLVTTVSADADADKIRALAEKAKSGCPISKLLKAELSLEVRIA